MYSTKYKDSSKLKQLLLGIFAVMALALLVVSYHRPVSVSAASVTCADGTVIDIGASSALNHDVCGSRGGTEANRQFGDRDSDRDGSVNSQDGSGGGGGGSATSKDCKGGTLTKDNCAIIKHIVTFTKVLSVSVGVIVTIMIAWGGIKYSMSKDNPQETAAAKTIIRNAIVAIICYLFSFAFLEWLTPWSIL